jgi:hypothetical protein
MEASTKGLNWMEKEKDGASTKIPWVDVTKGSGKIT